MINSVLPANWALNGHNFVLQRTPTESLRSVPATISSRSATRGQTDAFGVSYGLIAVPPADLVKDVARVGSTGTRASNRRIVNM